VTVAEYLIRVVYGLHRLLADIQDRLDALPAGDDWALDALGQEMTIRWRELLEGIEPPPEMQAVHNRLVDLAWKEEPDLAFSETLDLLGASDDALP
jgi:hypothetical protein